MDPELLQALEEEAITYYREPPKDILERSFPKQCEFLDHPAKLKTLWCTRRAAKSYTGGLGLVQHALANPGCNCLYLGLTRLSAKGIMWKDILKRINNKHDLGMEFNGTELTATLPNGSVIYLTGVDTDEEEMEKLLGKKYKFVFIDEAQSYSINLRALIYGVLGPAVVDDEGTICLAGTAGNITQGLFFDITNNKEPGWKLFTWSAHDNPYVARQWSAELEKIDKERPLFKETPLYRQWYLNQWVIDTEKLVYKFNHQKNIFKDLPYEGSKGWTYILGVDTGWEDDNAFVLCGYHENDPCLYVIDAFKKPHMYFDHEEQELSVLKTIEKYCSDPRHPAGRVVIDGANKQGVETMKMRTPIYFEYADKTGKVDHIEMMNGDLLQGKLKVHYSCQSLIDEMMGLVWKSEGDKIIYPKKEHPSLPNHLCDSLLYAFVYGTQFLAREALIAPMPGTAAYIKDQEDKHKEAIREKIKREQAIKAGDPYQAFKLYKDKSGRDPWNNWD